jgi:DNA-binding Xre family transcriptional regulator
MKVKKIKPIIIEEEDLNRKRTKLEKILIKRNLSQGDLRRMVQQKSGFLLGRDRVSKICTGKTLTYNLETAVMISEALGVKIDSIIECKNVRKKNSK